METTSTNIEKKRRGPRKTKILDNKELVSSHISTLNQSETTKNEVISNNKDNSKIKEENIIIDTIQNECVEDLSKIPKKRGRKPKGGKIISQNNENSDNQLQNIPNIILHLKCKMSDLEKYNSLLLDNNINDISNTNNQSLKSLNEYQNKQDFLENNNSSELNEIEGLDTYEQFGKMNKTSDLGYLIIDAPTNLGQNNYVYSTANSDTIMNKNNSTICNYNSNCSCDKNNTTTTNDMNTIWKKLKDLEVQLHKNDISDKRSACFWDTCEFDTPPVYIPRVQFDNAYHVYGCFCSPECAVAYLLKENIDAATRFERLHLLNHMYGKICNYERSIKPAPDPYYTLDKYYGNLSIQEFRKLLKSERLLLVVDLPLTRELPEIHLDNGDYLIGGQSIPTTGKYKVKKVSQKTTKANIMQERFGVSK